MDKYVFVNSAINDSVVLYLQSKDDDKSIEYNSFLACVVRMLILIYDEDSIVNAYYNKDIKGFDDILKRYGYPEEELKKFKDSFARFYAFENGQKDRVIKKKNRYFNFVQKALIDMLVYRNNVEIVDIQIKKELYSLLFTANTKDYYRKSFAIRVAINPYEIDEYFKKQGLLVLG